jgi:hypothetical protein
MLMSIVDSLIAGFALTVVSYVIYAAYCLVRAWISNRRQNWQRATTPEQAQKFRSCGRSGRKKRA